MIKSFQEKFQLNRLAYEQELGYLVEQGRAMRVLTLNQMVRPGKDRLRYLETVFAREFTYLFPTVLCLQEVSEVWGEYNTAVILAQSYGYNHQEYFYKVHPDVREGLAILYSPRYHQEEFFSYGIGDDRILLGNILSFAGNKTYIFNTHLSYYPEAADLRRQQLARVKALIAEIVPAKAPTILAGDFNYFHELEPSQAGELMSDYEDSYAVSHPGNPGYTFLAEHPLNPYGNNQRVDLIYANGLSVVSSFLVFREPPYATDHLGVVTDFLF